MSSSTPPPRQSPLLESTIDSRDPPSHGPQHRMISEQDSDIQSMPPPPVLPAPRMVGTRERNDRTESYDGTHNEHANDTPSLNLPPSTVKSAKVSNMNLDLAVKTGNGTPVPSTNKMNPIMISTNRTAKHLPPNHFSTISTPMHKNHRNEFITIREHNSPDTDQAVAQAQGQVPDSNTTCHTTSSTVSSPPGTPFRFTSFPASLPRVNPRTTDRQRQDDVQFRCQQTPLSSGSGNSKSPFQSPFRNTNTNSNTNTNTVRKRMNFADSEFEGGDANDGSIDTDAPERFEYPTDNDEDDESHDEHNDSHDTTLSSLSIEGGTNNGKTPGRHWGRYSGFRGVQTPFQGISGFGSSHTAHTGSEGFPFGSIPESGATNRAVYRWLSPILSDEKQNFLEEIDEGVTKSGDKDNDALMGAGEEEKEKVPVLNPRTKLNFNTILSPSESSGGDAGARKRHSFIDECQSPQDDTTPARKMANRKDKKPFLSAQKTNSFPPVESESLHPGEGHFAPFQIGVSDDDQRYKLSPMEADFRLQLETTQCSPIRSVPEDMDMEKSPCYTEQKKLSAAQSPSHSTVMSVNSASSAASTLRKLRPMPDMSAFDMGSNATITSGIHPESVGDHASESAASSRIPMSPMKHCPPTPLRTPAWAFKNSTMTRSNSLISTKILAACPPQVIDGFSSLEDSLCVDEKHEKSFSVEENSSVLLNSFSKDSKPLPPLYGNGNGTCDRNGKYISKRRSSKGVFKTIGDTSSETESIDGESKLHFDSSRKQAKQPRLSTDFHQPGGVVSFDLDFDNVSLLGSGAFADVYKAKCKSDGQFYAVKQNRRQFRGRRDRERALTEIRIMQKLQNASVSEWKEASEKSKSSYCLYLLFFIRAWQEDGYLFCQTDLCCRDTCKHLMLNLTTHWDAASRTYPSLLKHLMEEEIMDECTNEDVQRLVPENTVWKICHDVACGLSHIHSHNIVHHDIKPLNIFFVYHAKLGALCKIGDFGMAGEIGTSEDGQEGDTAYMPGELLGNAEKHPKGDIFSLGITLYELASSGAWILPSEGPRWHTIRDASHVPQLPKTRSSIMINLVKRMISPTKSDRPTADEILTDNAFLNDSAIQYDKFLADYIRDVNNLNAAKEHEANEVQQQLARSRQTPTPMQSKQPGETDRSWNVRTPTPGIGPFT